MMNVQQQQPQQGGNQNVTPFHSASLYVGDLTPDIAESQLFEIFNQVGPVASIRVCRDTVTRRSLGYAYVNFHNVADAERALDTMNFTLIKNQPCRIMWSQRDPSLRRSGVGNIFVKNLDTSVDNKALYDTFSLFGNILSCKVATDENSESKGYGYVHYETAEAANEAIAKIDGMMIAGKQVHVGHFIRRNDRAGQADWTNIYVKNLPLSWNESKLREEFGKFGAITSLKVQAETAGEDGVRSKGFGFINFEEHGAAEAAVTEMNGKVVGGSGKQTAAKTSSNDAATAAPTTNGDAAASDKKEGEDAAAASPAAAAAADSDDKVTAADSSSSADKPAPDADADADATAPATTVDDSDKKSASDEPAAVAASTEEADEEEPRELFVCRAQKKSERARELQQKYESLKLERMSKYQGVNLYVKNLDEAVDEAGLRDAFAAHGTITSARIMKDPTTGNSKGFGFVCFSSPEEATKAVQEMNNRMIVNKPIYVALAQRKEVRRAQLEAQYSQRAGGMGPPRGPMGMQPGMYGMPYMMGQPGMAGPPQRAGGYPMMPQMMPRGAPRGPMQPYPERGTYPMPAYAMGAMPMQQQQPQQRRAGAAGGNVNGGGAGGARPRVGGPAGVMPQGVSPVPVMNGGVGVGLRGPQQPMGAQQQAAAQQQQVAMQQQQQQQRGVGPQGGMPMQGQSGAQQQQQRGMPGSAQGGPQQGPGNFKYTQQVRNQPGGMQQQGSGMQQQQPQVSMMQGGPAPGESLTAQALAAASPEMQKNMIGERLYPLIYEVQPDLAGKITGMLLEMDNGELLHLLESPDALKAKIQEALQVLEQHSQGEQQ